MLQVLFTYLLSEEADNDLEKIYDYTVVQFGFDQAAKYLNEFERIFKNPCSNPEVGRKRNEVRKGLRSFSNKNHTIFYRILTDHIRIVRILHSSRDIIRFLPPQE